MSDMLSQDEINALLGGALVDSTEDGGSDGNDSQNLLSDLQKDILGEIGNISMGTAATTLFSLLNQKVNITSPNVQIMDWIDIKNRYDTPCVGVKIGYKAGLEGSNTLVLKNNDVKIITSLMMGGDGSFDPDSELSELDLSAIGEAMNQMIGSSSTSLASFLDDTIDIDTPIPFTIGVSNDVTFTHFGLSDDGPAVIVFFKLQIGDLINSTILQVMPINFAANLSDRLIGTFGYDEDSQAPPPKMEEKASEPTPAPVQTEQSLNQGTYNQAPPPVNHETSRSVPPPVQSYTSTEEDLSYMQSMMMQRNEESRFQQDVNAQPVQFKDFDKAVVRANKENIDLLMDVPLDVTVELGKTSKTIKEILEFSPGTIIELDKLAGEPIDILVNGKYVAKGEVVVIDENFAIRVTSIISAELRI